MKKIVALLGMLLMLLAMPFMVYAADNVAVYVNDLELGTEGVVVGGRTLTPVRDISEALGANVIWDASNKKITITKEMYSFGSTSGEPHAEIRKIVMHIGAQAVFVNDAYAFDLDVPAQIINDKTMVPIRAVSELFEATVGWDAETKKVHITTAWNNSFTDAKAQRDAIANSEQEAINKINEKYELKEVLVQWLSQDELKKQDIYYVPAIEGINKARLEERGWDVEVVYEFSGDSNTDIQTKVLDGEVYFWQADLLELEIISEPITKVVLTNK